MTETETVRLHAIINGRVQGVLFRDSTCRRARSAGVSGWIRNHPAGSVELVLEGKRDAVERVLDFCRVGPPGAQVDSVEVRVEQPQGEQSFELQV